MSLINWTEGGVKNFRDTTQRAEDFSKLVESSGGQVRELAWTVGQYDLVCIAEFPDDETGTAALFQVGATGNIRSQDDAGLQRRRDGWHYQSDRLNRVA